MHNYTQHSAYQELTSQFKKKLNLPAALFNRSPIAQPPQRVMTERSFYSPSPFELNSNKNRRQESVTVFNENINILNCQDKQNNSFQKYQHQTSISQQSLQFCENHNQKPAKYYVVGEDDILPYCEKCAILLASQGFKVTKKEEQSSYNLKPQTRDHQRSQSSVDHVQDSHNISQEDNNNIRLINLGNHPRKAEITKFLGELQELIGKADSKKRKYTQILSDSNMNFSEQIQRIDNYFARISQSIEAERDKVIILAKQKKLQAEEKAQEQLGVLEECINSSLAMKEDILGSLDVIRCVEEAAFRPVMQSYKEKASQLTGTESGVQPQQTLIKDVLFNDVEQVVRKVGECIQVKFSEAECNQDYLIQEGLGKQRSSVSRPSNQVNRSMRYSHLDGSQDSGCSGLNEQSYIF